MRTERTKEIAERNVWCAEFMVAGQQVAGNAAGGRNGMCSGAVTAIGKAVAETVVNSDPKKQARTRKNSEPAEQVSRTGAQRV